MLFAIRVVLDGAPVRAETSKPGPSPQPAPLDHTRFELPNGLTVYVIEDHTAPTVCEVMWVRAGSKDEVARRTGFAHLFEHLMFKGSAHVPDGRMDQLLERAGGWSNAFTSLDQTVYQNVAASNFLEQILWLEADRLAGLTDALNQKQLDNQRDVVLNERRESYENRPYGIAELLIQTNLWPSDFGYHWLPIGYTADLRAATLGDVVNFFKTYYVPNNATIVIAGDVVPAQVKQLVHKYFAWMPRAPAPARPVYPQPAPIAAPIAIESTDDVQVPRVHVVWRGPPAYSVDEPALGIAAAMLGGGKSSRLFKRLVYDQKIAQNVHANFEGNELAGEFRVVVTAKPGVDAQGLVNNVLDEVAKLATAPAERRELERAINSREADFLVDLEPLVERAVLLAQYAVMANDAGYFAKDLARYRAVKPAQVRDAVAKYLAPATRLVVTIKPGRKAAEPAPAANSARSKGRKP